MSIATELAALPRLSVGELQKRYTDVSGESTQARNKAWLVKRIAWRLQANAEGSLSERARQRIAELANDADLRITAPRIKSPGPGGPVQTVVIQSRVPADHRLPMPGTVLSRAYKGCTVQVMIRDDGLEHEGVLYKSLSAVARPITGTHCNGYHFFRLNQEQP